MAAAAAPGDEAVTVAEEWLTRLIPQDQQAEAVRCWGADADGKVPGYIAELTPPGMEYDTAVMKYRPAPTPAQPDDPRPWSCPPGPAPEVKIFDQREGDLAMAMQYFDGDRAGDAPAGTIVDIGCGDGYMARGFAESGRFERVFATDVSWPCLEATRAAAEEQRLGPEQGLLLFRADAQAFPFQEGQLDFVWWGMGLHKVYDGKGALKSVFKSMRPGGKILLTAMVSSPDKVRKFSVQSLVNLFAEIGFQDIGAGQVVPTVGIVEATRP